MPLLEIATAQPDFRSRLGVVRAKAPTCSQLFSTFTFGCDRWLTSSWKSLKVHRKIYSEPAQTKFVIKAVVTLEPKRLAIIEDGQRYRQNLHVETDTSPCGTSLQSSGKDSDSLDDREKLRRMRISKANKGNTPWNKGRKHSAETLQRIKERTRLAMQNPKVKMKLVNLGHAQTEETRQKIGAGVRLGWQKRREKLTVQENCHYEWQNIIAEASRRGFSDERELQWDSYDTLNVQLEQEWIESMEERKTTRKQKGNKRAPKSPEQRRKIAAAIAAKWADPAYRERVFSGLSKYHGVPVGVKGKPRRTPRSSTDSTRRSPTKRKIVGLDSSKRLDSQTIIQRMKSKRSNNPLYKDPLASSKLEMIKNIRAKRAAAETDKADAIERARLLIAEAEQAAKALEAVAVRSPIALASLEETRKLIAEAIQSIESIESCDSPSTETGSILANQGLPLPQNHSDTLSGPLDHKPGKIKVNGSAVRLQDPEEETDEFGLEPQLGFSQLSMDDATDDSTEEADKKAVPNEQVNSKEDPLAYESETKVHTLYEDLPSKPTTTRTKKWVRGRLIEVTE